jgi:formylglycine-generating enzyme required for sulfatase activity
MSAAAGRSPDFGSITLSMQPSPTGPLEFPAEMVFVPSFDEEPLAPVSTGNRVLPDPIFEDEEADDEFEQSLSGLRLDEIDEDVETQIVEQLPESVDIELPPEVGPVEKTPVEIKPAETESAELAIVEPTFSAIPVASPTNRRWITATLLVLFGLISFAAGALATILIFEMPQPIPGALDLPVAGSAQPANVPPVGMVIVPGGEFMMGSDEGDAFSRPSHLVSVRPFYIDVTEVTNAAYSEFVKATSHEPPAAWTNGRLRPELSEFPVTGVSWYDALEFAAWKGMRLPTEAEWEFAARGTDGRIYPWGNEWDQSLANAAKTAEGIREVGQGGTSPFGALDMSGNAWEWTASDAKSIPGGKQIPWSRLRLKVIRGGNWQSDSKTATTYFRGFYGAVGEKEYNSTGFRCVKDLPKN